MARVLVPEKLSEAGLAVLREAGHEVDVQLDLSDDQLLAAITGAQALIVRSATIVHSELLKSGSDLVVVGRAGVGLDNIDVAAATSQGVMVCNAPQSNVVSAAEHAVALMFALARNIPQAHAALAEGRWERSSWSGVEVLDKTIGVIGLGRVGRLVAERLLNFGVRLVAYDPYVTAEAARELNVEMLELDELLACSDFLTVHLPKNPETIGLLNYERLSLCKHGARIVNTARGGIIVEDDLARLLDEGVIAGAALDVFDKEPTTVSPLFGRSNVVVTPHLGASTAEAQHKAGLTIAEQVVLALEGEFVPFAVNIAADQASDAMRPYLPIGERLGTFLSCLVDAPPDDLEIRVSGDLANYDRRILLLSVLRGVLSKFASKPVTFVNANTVADELGVLVRDFVSHDAGQFRGLVEVRGGGHSVAGTLTRNGKEPRIVQIDDHSIEVPLSKHLIVFTNDDCPGIIGAVGTVFGNALVNISFMGLGRDVDGENALMALAVDTEPQASLLSDLKKLSGVQSVSSVFLG